MPHVPPVQGRFHLQCFPGAVRRAVQSDADCPPSFYFPPPADYTVSGLYCDAADRLCKAPVRHGCDEMVIEIGTMHGA